MRLSGKKAVILVSNEFEDLEVFYPMLRLSEEGIWVTLGTLKASTHPRPAIPLSLIHISEPTRPY